MSGSRLKHASVATNADHFPVHLMERRFRVSNVACGYQYTYAAKQSRLRILGGGRPETGAFPWQALILKGGKHHCGASVISPNWILTAAHCFRHVSEPLQIVVGSYHWRNAYGKGRLHSIRDTVIYPSFRPSVSYGGDIAVARVSPPIVYTSGDVRGRGAIAPICLPIYRQRVLSSSAEICGWGKVSEKGAVANMILCTNVNILPNQMCVRAYDGPRTFLPDSMICAGAIGGGRDACQGDSGGPLVTTINGRFVQIGVISYGEGCGRPLYPGVYTKVSSYRNWIKEVTGV